MRNRISSFHSVFPLALRAVLSVVRITAFSCTLALGVKLFPANAFKRGIGNLLL